MKYPLWSKQKSKTNVEQTIVGIYHWVMFRFPEYFKDPEEYIPERHLEDERFKDDNRGVLQPFSYGPRNCIGRK